MPAFFVLIRYQLDLIPNGSLKPFAVESAEPLNDGIRINLMLEAIANIEQFMAGCPSLEEFTANKLLCHAVIYNFQCIGACLCSS